MDQHPYHSVPGAAYNNPYQTTTPNPKNFSYSTVPLACPQARPPPAAPTLEALIEPLSDSSPSPSPSTAELCSAAQTGVKCNNTACCPTPKTRKTTARKPSANPPPMQAFQMEPWTIYDYTSASSSAKKDAPTTCPTLSSSISPPLTPTPLDSDDPAAIFPPDVAVINAPDWDFMTPPTPQNDVELFQFEPQMPFDGTEAAGAWSATCSPTFENFPAAVWMDNPAPGPVDGSDGIYYSLDDIVGTHTEQQKQWDPLPTDFESTYDTNYEPWFSGTGHDREWNPFWNPS